jgi:Fe-S cluster assembly protein SufB
MLRISKLADYAIVIMNELATRPGEFLSASELAASTHIGEATVGKLLKALSKNKLICSQLGSQGGYSLVKTPADINLTDIITAIEGKIAITECDRQMNCCDKKKTCTVSGNWQRISTAIRNALAEISLADMQRPVPEAVIKLKIGKQLKTGFLLSQE